MRPRSTTTLQPIQCALYQCAPPAAEVDPLTSLACDHPTARLPLYDDHISEEPHHLATRDYRGDCMLFIEPHATTFADLVELLQVRLNTYMILHGAPPHATPTNENLMGDDQSWPWCRKCHPTAQGPSVDASASDSADTKPTPCVLVRSLHRLVPEQIPVRRSELLAPCVVKQPLKQAPRYAVFFFLTFLPHGSSLRRALCAPEADAPEQSAETSPATTPADMSSSTPRFVHLKAAGHVMRAAISDDDVPIDRLVQTLAARRRLEVTRLVVEEAPHKPAVFPCESASVLARALTSVRAVINQKPSRQVAKLRGVDFSRWRYGDMRSFTGSVPLLAGALADGADRSSFNHRNELDSEVDVASNDAGTVISYSSFATGEFGLHDGEDGDSDDESTFQSFYGDARISLGDMAQFAGFSSMLSSSADDDDDTWPPRDAFVPADAEEEREEPFVASFAASDADVSSEERLVASVSVSSSTVAEEINGRVEDSEHAEDQDVELTAPLPRGAQHPSQNTVPVTDALWDLNNDFVFEVDDSSMSPARGGDDTRAATHANASSERATTPPHLRPAGSDTLRSPDAHRGTMTDASPSAASSSHRKPRLVVVSSPSSYRHSSHGGGSSGLPTPSHPPRPSYSEPAKEWRWHFSRAETHRGLFHSLPTGTPTTTTVAAAEEQTRAVADMRDTSQLPTSSRVPSSQETLVAIVGEPTLALSQAATSRPESQTLGVAPVTAKRSRTPSVPVRSPHRRQEQPPVVGSHAPSASPTRSNILDETPVDIALQQTGGDGAVDAPGTPPPTASKPRRRSPIVLSPGDLVFSEESIYALRASSLRDGHDTPVNQGFVDGSARAEYTPPGAIVYRASSSDAMNTSPVGEDELSRDETSNATAYSARMFTGRAPSVPGVMVTQQTMPEYARPDGHDSSSGATGSDDDTSSGDGGERGITTAGEDDEGNSDGSDDSDYVFTGL